MRTHNDSANAGPVGILIVIFSMLAFEGVIFGQTFAASAFPAITQPNFADCAGGTGLFSGFAMVGCVLYQFFIGLVAAVKIVFGVFVFIFYAVTFNVPGAPDIVRYFVATFIIIGVTWPIATLVRGGGGGSGA